MEVTTAHGPLWAAAIALSIPQPDVSVGKPSLQATAQQPGTARRMHSEPLGQASTLEHLLHQRMVTGTVAINGVDVFFHLALTQQGQTRHQ